MKTKITFKVITNNGKITRKTIPIKHNFKIKPKEIFLGYEFPEQSIESQVIEYLDSIDKSDLMNKYDWAMILDYYPYKKRKSKQQEFEEFIEYLKIITPVDIVLENIIIDLKDVLFGKGKSNYTKALEVFKIKKLALKTMNNTFQVIGNILKNNNLTKGKKFIS